MCVKYSVHMTPIKASYVDVYTVKLVLYTTTWQSINHGMHEIISIKCALTADCVYTFLCPSVIIQVQNSSVSTQNKEVVLFSTLTYSN